ncbi:MAG TPA: glycosyltransferase [bacterium]|jgi:glycosyltransferase involved in cell wall biosynthesis|nr:glycosyltransferase [bacterium]HOH85241.1 glycosyltransferase [bacterium]HQA84240.1 glycosyltransferase [bacterium]
MKQPLIASLVQIDQTLTVGLFSRWCNGRAVLWSTAGQLSDLWFRQSWPQISFPARAIIARSFFRLGLFLFLPGLYLLFWRRLATLVKQRQIDGLICLSWLDKIVLTQPALWLKLPVVWLRLPEESEVKLIAPLNAVYRHQAARVKLISYIPQVDDGQQLTGGISEQRLLPALDQASVSQQADLFDSLADGQREQVESKYFVVGAVVDLDNNQAVEILLRSLKIVLSVIPSVQLVIIGDGPQRKELQWLAKQLDLANLVWFVGRQEPLDKWFRSLDALIELSTTTSRDWYRLLQAMAVGLPIIAPKNRLTTDFLLPGQTAMIVEKPEPEMIAQAVIQLQQDKMLAGRLSWHSRQWIAEFGNLERQLIEFTNYLA